jgi:restriction system protein
MAVPTTNEFHRPILEIAAETAGALSARQFTEVLARRLNITEEDLQDRSSSGVRRFADRVQWSMHNLRLAGALVRLSRGKYQITDRGQAFLSEHDSSVTNGDLRRLQGELNQSDADGSHRGDVAIADTNEGDPGVTPKDMMDTGHERLQSELIDEIRENIARMSPTAFELLVLELLRKMGYGEPEHTGRSGDGGIDGIINQDALGLEKVYVQAKRWSNQVSEPDIRNFSGSLDPYGATKGVFITTSTFSSTARQTAQTISAGSKFIRLVDGNELAQLMTKHGVGVVTEYTYEIKKLDENYFAEDI